MKLIHTTQELNTIEYFISYLVLSADYYLKKYRVADIENRAKG